MKISLSILLALGLAACSSDSDPAETADAGATADAAPSEADASIPSATIISVGGDYNGSGVLTTLKIPEMEVTVNAVAGVAGGDPVLRAIGDRLVILDRFGGDSVTVLDRDLNLLGQVTTGTGSNPQDAAIIGTNLYIAALDATGVLVVDLEDINGGVTKTIDLSALDGDDGVPDCASIFAVGTRLYVACQILDRDTFAPRGIGKVAVIDTTDDSIELTLDLGASNPLARFQSLPGGDLVFSTAPGAIFNATNDAGCLEQISTTGTPSVLGCRSENTTRNSYPSEVVTVGNTVYFVNVVSFSEATILMNNNAGESAAGLSVGTNVGGMTKCPTGHIVVADNTDGARGLRVFDEAGTAMNTAPIDVGWPAFFSPLNATVCW
jgi:hypothetical protein